MSVHVTEHAIDRWIERIAPDNRDQARQAITASERAIEFAAAFGAHVVRLPNGAKLVCKGRGPVRVITVLGRAEIDGGRGEQLNGQPVCCGTCGVRSGHPVIRACTRTDCPLAARFAVDGSGRA